MFRLGIVRRLYAMGRPDASLTHADVRTPLTNQLEKHPFTFASRSDEYKIKQSWLPF